jgi:hypothetical protein
LRSDRNMSLFDSENEYVCMIQADLAGRFDVGALPAGDYTLRILPLGLRKIAEIHIPVFPGIPSYVEVPLAQENLVAECLRAKACAEILTRVPQAEFEATPEHGLTLFAYRLAFVLAGDSWDESRDWVLCVEGSAEAIRSLGALYVEVVDNEECEMTELPTPNGEGSYQTLLHRTSGRPARGVSVRLEAQGPDAAIVHTSFYAAPLYGGGFRCEVRYREPVWVAQRCTMTWVS